MTSVAIHKWVVRGQDLILRATNTLRNAPTEKVRSLAPRLPLNVAPADEGMRVVFAGQYSAGKSSIIGAITGHLNIEIGAGITTDCVREYDWGGISVVDTPGVHTQLRPDHDVATYDAISRADLLVFVVTNELFDSHLAVHFRKLAVERGKANEMMLVVNKMRRCAGGNARGVQDVIRDDLRSVVAPYSPEQLRTSFIDAGSALEAKDETDENVRRMLENKSGFRNFLENLNEFVRDRGLGGRYTTALYTLEQVLQEALTMESTGDPDVDALEELLLQQRRALVDAQIDLPRSVESDVQRTSASIRKEGQTVAHLIHGGTDHEEIDRALKAAQERVQERVDQLAVIVQATIEQHMVSLSERIGQIAESELARQLLPRLVHRLKVELADLDATPDALARAKSVSGLANRLGEFLAKNSVSPTAGTLAGMFKLNQYSGTATHTTVKVVGHLFGKSFKPWEAVKWTRTAANVGRVLSVVGTVLTFVVQIKEDADAAKLEVDLREGRSLVRAGFGEAAGAVEMHFDKATSSYVSTTIGQRLSDVDEQLAALREMQQSRGTLFGDLVALVDETHVLIRDMHIGSA